MGAELAPIIRGVLEAQKEQTELAQANARLGEELARTTAELLPPSGVVAVQRVRRRQPTPQQALGWPAVWTCPGARLPPYPTATLKHGPANAQAEHARRAGEQATQLKVDLAVAQQQVASLGAECAGQRMHAAEARRHASWRGAPARHARRRAASIAAAGGPAARAGAARGEARAPLRVRGACPGVASATALP